MHLNILGAIRHRLEWRKLLRSLPDGYMVLPGADVATGEPFTSLWRSRRDANYLIFECIAVIRAQAHTKTAQDELVRLAWKDQA